MRTLTVVTLIAVSVALAACGSSGPKRLSKEEFARRADGVCTRYQRQVAALGTPGDLKQFAPLAERTAAALEEALGSLRGLKPPENEALQVHRWLAQLGRLRTDAIRMRDRANANDLGGVERIATVARAHDRTFARLSTELGMHVCSANAG